jgi:hypothetical protein
MRPQTDIPLVSLRHTALMCNTSLANHQLQAADVLGVSMHRSDLSLDLADLECFHWMLDYWDRYVRSQARTWPIVRFNFGANLRGVTV